MSTRTSDDGLIGMVFEAIFYLLFGVFYILFVAPFSFWKFFTRKAGIKISLSLFLMFAAFVLATLLLWKMSPYGWVNIYVGPKVWRGFGRYLGYFLVSSVIVSFLYLLYHIVLNALIKKGTKISLIFGNSAKFKYPVMIEEWKRTEHVLALGATGTGKTTSVIEPAIQNDIDKGRGLLFITAKDDPAFVGRVYSYAKNKGREDDVRIFTLSDVPRTDSYNPLVARDETALRDLCMDAFSWDSPYYRDQARSALLYVFSALAETGKSFSLLDLYYIFTEKGCLDLLADMTTDPRTRHHLESYSKDWKQHRENNRGLAANLEDYTTNWLAGRVCDYSPDIDLVEAYHSNKIVLFVLNSLQYGETARRLGKMLIQNLRYLSGKVTEQGKKKFYPVYIDEFHHFVFPEFFSIVAQCRSSDIGLMLSTQSFADFKGDGWDITQQVIQNTNTKIILRQNDAESAEYAARLGGTCTTVKRTRQVEKNMLAFTNTGLGSEREVEQFLIHPNIIRSLKTGKAVFIREGWADIVNLRRAQAPISRHDPNDRPVIEKKHNEREGLNIYSLWKAAEAAKTGEGVRRPAIKKASRGLDSIREKIDSPVPASTKYLPGLDAIRENTDQPMPASAKYLKPSS